MNKTLTIAIVGFIITSIIAFNCQNYLEKSSHNPHQYL